MKGKYGKKYGHAEQMAVSQNLKDNDESFGHLFGRVVKEVVFKTELNQFKTPLSELSKFIGNFHRALIFQDIALSTPILINGGRKGKEDRALTSCVVPPRDVVSGKLRKNTLSTLYDHEMGAGYDMDETIEEPIKILKWLDEQAREGEKKSKRRACNMVSMSVNHPNIFKFISAKKNTDFFISKANISVMIDERFMIAVKNNNDYQLDLKILNEKQNSPKIVKARYLFEKIIECSHRNGEPGIIFKDRLKEDNPTPSLGESVSTSPCGEVGLAPGEACQFSYLNLGNMVINSKIDWNKISTTTGLLIRFLDDALQHNLPKYPYYEIKKIMSAKRKIGIGVLGLADMLIDLDISYGSEEAVMLIKDIMAFINYHSKLASIELAKKRGPFVAFPDSNYMKNNNIIKRRYICQETKKISSNNWATLLNSIRKNGIRHALTIAVPPTGRSSQLIEGATASIEPMWSCYSIKEQAPNHSKGLFKIVNPSGNEMTVHINPRLQTKLKDCNIDIDQNFADLMALKNGSIQHIKVIPEYIRNIFKTTVDITPEQHVNMTAAVQAFSDESVSKTVNLPKYATYEDIKKIYILAWESGLKGLTVFRDGCIGEKNQLKVIAN